MSSRNARISDGEGGSFVRNSSAIAPEPILNERTWRTPPSIEPRMISEEPPPTSTTPISPSTGWPSVFVAPMNASRPSSSSPRTSTGTPATRPISAAASAAFLDSRMAAVATTRIASEPSSCASRTCVSTTSASSAIFSAVTLPFCFESLSNRV